MFIRLLVVLTLLLPSVASSAEKTVIVSSDKVKEQVLSQNVPVQLARIDRDIARQNLPAARSIYDTTLRLRVNHLHDELQRTSGIFGTQNKITEYDVEVLQKTPLGTELSGGFLNERTSTDAPFTTINPAYDSRGDLRVRQPVARNAFGFIDRKQIELVRKQLQAVDFSTHSLIEAQVYQALTAYWRFYLAHHMTHWDQVEVTKAREMAAAGKRKKELGIIEQPDVYAFAANADIQETRWLMDRDVLATTTEQLRQLVGADPYVSLRPAKENLGAREIPSLANAMAAAFSIRPDYLAAKKEIEAANIRVSINKNNLWPQLDVLGSMTLNGVDREYADAVDNIAEAHEAWSVGMEFSLPLQNRLRRSDYKKSQYQRVRRIMELKNKELEIIRQVNDSFKRIQNARTRVAAALRAESNQFQKWQGEMTQFEQGRSDSDIVIRYQNDYIEAKKMALQSQVDLKLALLDLKFAQGKVLD